MIFTPFFKRDNFNIISKNRGVQKVLIGKTDISFGMYFFLEKRSRNLEFLRTLK